MARRNHTSAATVQDITESNVDTVDTGLVDAVEQLKSDNDGSDTITVLRVSDGHIAAKTITATEQGVDVGNYNAGAKFTLESFSVEDIHSLADVLTGLAPDPTRLVIRGQLGPGRGPSKKDGMLYRRKIVPGSWQGYFEPVPRRWVCVDVDEPLLMKGMSQITDPEAVVRYAQALLGKPWQDVTVYWQASSRAGLPGVRKVKLHLWFWFDRPVDDVPLRAKFRHINKIVGIKVVDAALADSIQIHFTAAPRFVGMDDPLPKRHGILVGKVDAVPVDHLHLPLAATKTPKAAPNSGKASAAPKAPVKVKPAAPPRLPGNGGQRNAEVRQLRPRTGLYGAVLDDILALARHRHGTGGVGDGERDLFLFAAATAAVNIHPGRMEAAVRELAAILVPQKSEEWIAAKLSGLEQRVCRHMAGERVQQGHKMVSPIYGPTIAWFIDFLSIDADEMVILDKLINDTVRKRRKRGLSPRRKWQAESREHTADQAMIAAELYFRRSMQPCGAATMMGISERWFWVLLTKAFPDIH